VFSRSYVALPARGFAVLCLVRSENQPASLGRDGAETLDALDVDRARRGPSARN